MAKFKAEIHDTFVTFDNIYRKTLSGAIQAAKKQVDMVRRQERQDLTSEAVIKVYEGSIIDTPYYQKKQTISYNKLVHEEKYENVVDFNSKRW